MMCRGASSPARVKVRSAGERKKSLEPIAYCCEISCFLGSTFTFFVTFLFSFSLFLFLVRFCFTSLFSLPFLAFVYIYFIYFLLRFLLCCYGIFLGLRINVVFTLSS